MGSMISRYSDLGRRISTLAILMVLSFALVGPVRAAPPDYKQAMVRGAFLEALPLAIEVFAETERERARWREVALDVARLQIDTGRYAKAEAMLSDIRNLLGAKPDPAAAATEAHLRGLLRVEQERNADAAVAYSEALKARTALYGADHPAVAEVLSDFGQLLSFEDKFEASERLLKQALDIQTRHLGRKTLPVSVTLSYLASLAESRGDAEQAMKLAEQALHIQRPSRDHPRTANTLFTLSRAKAALDDSDGAIAALNRSLAIDRASRGENHPYLAISNDELAELYQRTGALQLARAARETSYRVNLNYLGPGHAYTLDSQTALATAHKQIGAYPQSVALLRDLVPRLRAAKGDTSNNVLLALNSLGEVLSLAADLPGAETVYRQLLIFVERRFGADHEETAAVLNNLGNILVAQGRYGDAEPVLKRAIDTIERKLGPDHPLIGAAVGNLGYAYLEQGLVERARPLLQRTLIVLEARHGNNSLETAKAVNNLALAELLGGWYEDSTENFRRAIAIIEKARGPQHPELTNPLNNLALAFERLGRGAEGRAPLARAIAIAEAKLGDGHTRTAELRHGMAKLLGGLGEYDEAQGYLGSVLATLKERLGPDHPRSANVLFTFALFDMQRKARPPALARLRQLRAIFEKRAALAVSSPSLDATAELRKAEKSFMFHLTALGSAESVGLADVAEAFEVAQLTQLGAAATAVNRMAARFAAGDGSLAQRARARQDAANRWARADAALTDGLGLPQDQRDLEAENNWRVQRNNAAERLKALDTELAREFPRYQQLTGVRPMKLAAARALLGPDEVLMTFMTIDEQTAMIATRGGEAQLHIINMGAAELSSLVDRIRRGLDPTQMSDIADLHNFDAATAHALYTKLFAPAEDLLKGARHIFVVPDAALTSLPVGVLLTEAPKTDRYEFDAYRYMPWLANRFAISVLPSVSALRSLRQLAGRPVSRTAMLGIGDPLLADHPNLSGPSPAEMQVNQFTAMRGRGASVPDLFRNNGLADVEAVKSLPSLPDTKDELEALRKAIGGEASVLLLQDQATEGNLRARTDLADYGILVFATHGLVGGELDGLSEPALVMTPPKVASARDDGLLTASEISTLSLNADWVVLSACNTASGGADGEGLSGLAKAFFYAGSRALFVSHWPVASDAAVKLTTAMFRAQAQSPGIGKAEAHRRAIAVVMADRENPMYAHPLFWAPFVVVGDGGTYRAK